MAEILQVGQVLRMAEILQVAEALQVADPRWVIPIPGTVDQFSTSWNSRLALLPCLSNQNLIMWFRQQPTSLVIINRTCRISLTTLREWSDQKRARVLCVRRGKQHVVNCPCTGLPASPTAHAAHGTAVQQ
jgi:hypothetical protein